MTDVPQVRLTGRAVRYVQLLHEYGHLDHDGVDRLLLGVAELAGPDHSGPIDLPIIRRAAALLVFPSDGEASPTLAADWPMLFS